MTITVQPARNEYTANAGQTIFNYTFKIFSDTDLNVYITPAGDVADDDTQLTTAYTVTGIGDEDGGSITLATGTNQEDLVTIVSNIPSSRTIDYQNNGDFRPATVNSDFDRVVSIAKKIEDTANRTLLLQQSQQDPKPLTLPSPVAGKFLKWKGDLSGMENATLSDIDPVDLELFLTNDLSQAYEFPVLDDAVTFDKLVVGKLCHIAERTTGNGGGAMWDVVLASSVTPNGFDIVACTGVPTLALVLRVSGTVDVKQLGAIAGQDTSLIVQAAIDLNVVNKVIADDEYTWENQVNLKSNLEIDGLKSGILTMGAGLVDIAILGQSVNDVLIHGLTMQTVDASTPTGGLQRFIQVEDGRRITCKDMYFFQCKNQPLTYDGCLYSVIKNINSNNSYGTAVTLRNNCQMCNVSQLNLRENGVYEGVTGSFGRGLLVWQSNQITISDVNINSSTEYGFRIYSQSDDIYDCKDITITNMTIRDSGSIDFFIYNESLRISDVSISNLDIKTTGTGKVAVSLQGTNIILNGANIASETAQSNTCLSLFALDHCLVTNVISTYFNKFASFGASSPASNVTIKGCKANGLLVIASSLVGTGHVIDGNEFTFHSSASALALGLTADRAEITNNTFDGAYRCIEFSASPSKITGNSSLNTIDSPVRVYGTSIAGMNIANNSWDSPTNPPEFGRISEYGVHGDRLHAILITNAIPTYFTDYPVRSIAYSYNSSAPSHIGWTQTEIGVWKTFGAITP